MANEQRNQSRNQPQSARDPGEPGGGRGRRDEVGGSGVYPASAQGAPADAEIRTQNAWGQGDRGAAGYEDSGPSELHLSRAAEEETNGEQRKEER